MTRVEFRVMQMKLHYHLYSMRLILALQRRGILNNAKAESAFDMHARKGIEYEKQLMDDVRRSIQSILFKEES